MLGSVLLTLVAAEQAARRFWEPPQPIQYPPLPDEYEDLEWLQDAQGLARPNVRAINAGVLFETNSAGFRGPEVAPGKPREIFRVAVIGDSYSMGWGVNREDTYAVRLEQALGTSRPDLRIEVLNFGLAGQDTEAVVERFHTLGLDYEPDLVVYGFSVNDLENDAYRHTSVSADVAAKELEESRLTLWRIVAPRMSSLAEVTARKGSYVHELDVNYFEEAEAFGVALEALDRLADTAEQRGICAVMLIHTQLRFLNFLHPYQRHYDALASAAEEHGLFVVPTAEAFLGHGEGELRIKADDPHPGAEAHAILADELLAALEELPERCWSGAR